MALVFRSLFAQMPDGPIIYGIGKRLRYLRFWFALLNNRSGERHPLVFTRFSEDMRVSGDREIGR